MYDHMAKEIQCLLTIMDAFKCFSYINFNKFFVFSFHYTRISHPS